MTAAPTLLIGLNAVLTALDGHSPKVLCVEREGRWGLPFGRFDPAQHRTFEKGLRDFVDRQTAVPLGYVEQLYTFGDMGRESPKPSMQDNTASDRIISIGYLGLAPALTAPGHADAVWHDWYTYFPWEDWRNGQPRCISDDVLPALTIWAKDDDARIARIKANFGLDGMGWEEERSLDRYELMYEAGIVGEAIRDGWHSGAERPMSIRCGRMMTSDHRRILATAIGRLRGKLRYRPVVFQMMPIRFTLTDLQTAVETILGFNVHKQNFRRSVEGATLVERTNERTVGTGGRPAALYTASTLARDKLAPGLALPRLKEDASGG